MKLLNTIFNSQFGPATPNGNLALWPYLWAASLAVVWLLPVGAVPWTTYAADLWMAIVALFGGVTVLLIARKAVPWHATAVGTAWEKLYPAQFMNLFAGAVLFAAIASVGLQLYAWSGLSDAGALGPLFAGVSRSRPSGALGQPNQLATFLLWGLIASFYFYDKKTIGGRGVLAVAGFLLLGLALTQSRTGILSAVCLWAWICFHRNMWERKFPAHAVTGLLIYFLICPYILER